MNKTNVIFPALIAGSFCISSVAEKTQKPNVVILFADDISAREFPIYGSSVWSSPQSNNTSDLRFRAKTPVIDNFAQRGCWVLNTWAATVCNPSRAMMMSGRYAYQTKWWNNKDKGYGPDEDGKIDTWPVYMSSPLTLGTVAQKSGYGTYWAGKTQMAGSYAKHGFDEGCFTPGGDLNDNDNPFTDFKLEYKNIGGKRVMVNSDTDQPCNTYLQHGWYWYPHVKLMNDPSAPNQIVWWPNTPESKKKFGLGTFGPDVELQFVFNFMERKHSEGKPFFVYHTTHLGHDAFNWLNPQAKSKWPATPIVKWDGEKYTRTEPFITIGYGANEQREIIVELQKPDGSIITNKTVTIERGVGSTSVNIALASTLAVNEGYKFKASIRPVGGTSSDNLFGTEAVFKVIEGEVSPTEDAISFIEVPSAISTEDLSVPIKVRYSATTNRDINIEVKDAVYITNSLVTVPPGTGEKTILITFASKLAVKDGYKFILSIRPVGGNWQTAITKKEVSFNVTSSGTATLTESNIKNEVKIYPNPFKNMVHYTNNGLIDSVQVYNVMGQLLLSQASENGLNTIMLEDCSHGLYMVKFSYMDKGQQVLRIVKQ